LPLRPSAARRVARNGAPRWVVARATGMAAEAAMPVALASSLTRPARGAARRHRSRSGPPERVPSTAATASGWCAA